MDGTSLRGEALLAGGELYTRCAVEHKATRAGNTLLFVSCTRHGWPYVCHQTDWAMKGEYLPALLHELLTAHRIELIDRCREKAAKRLAPGTAPIGLEHGVPLFLDQIIKTLQIE